MPSPCIVFNVPLIVLSNVLTQSCGLTSASRLNPAVGFCINLIETLSLMPYVRTNVLNVNGMTIVVVIQDCRTATLLIVLRDIRLRFMFEVGVTG